MRATTRRKEKTFLLGECPKRARGAEIARYFEEIARARGPGAFRAVLLSPGGEKEFLVGLILSEAGQEALGGVVLDAVAQASGLPGEGI